MHTDVNRNHLYNSTLSAFVGDGGSNHHSRALGMLVWVVFFSSEPWKDKMTAILSKLTPERFFFSPVAEFHLKFTENQPQ